MERAGLECTNSRRTRLGWTGEFIRNIGKKVAGERCQAIKNDRDFEQVRRNGRRVVNFISITSSYVAGSISNTFRCSVMGRTKWRGGGDA